MSQVSKTNNTYLDPVLSKVYNNRREYTFKGIRTHIAQTMNSKIHGNNDEQVRRMQLSYKPLSYKGCIGEAECA